jgi:hypothetical protein
MCCPAIALLCGIAIAHWEGFWTQETRTAWVPMMVVAIALIFSSIDGFITMKIALAYDNFKARLSSVIAQSTRPENKLIVFDPDDWGGEVLFRSGRKGLCVQYLQTLPGRGASKSLCELLASQADLQRLKSLGYDRLVLLSESPVRFAAEAINPGSKRIRRFFPASISESVDSWPVVYQSQEIQIKQIP